MSQEPIALRPAKMEDAVHGRWVGYVSVKDVPQALAAATSGGGRILFPARSLPQQGIKGIFIDPDGAELGVMNSSSGDPAEYTPESGDWTWSELFARDPVKAGQYYKSVAGYDVIPDTRTDRADTLILVSGGYSRAGVLPVPNRPKARPAWLLFVRVASVKDTIARVVPQPQHPCHPRNRWNKHGGDHERNLSGDANAPPPKTTPAATTRTSARPTCGPEAVPPNPCSSWSGS